MTPAPSPDGASPSKGPGAKANKKPETKVDPLFPERTKRGWKEMTGADKLAINATADAYVDFISTGKTPRRAVAALVEIAEAAGARAMKDGESGLTGFHYALGPGGEAAVFFRSGSAPLSSGLSVIVVSVDAPRLVLKQNPNAHRNDIDMLQTDVHGKISLRSWMIHPLALDVVANKRGKTIKFSIGERPDDPILSIPDLLPHLSRGLQRRGKEVSEVERLDALGGVRPGALSIALRSRGLTVADLAAAEATLVPAGKARRIGVDRALIGGYGHKNRALAFSAVRALGEASLARAAAVVVVGRSEADDSSGTGYPYAARAIRMAIASLSEGEVDALDMRLIARRTVALVGRSAGGQNSGLTIDIASADSLPIEARRLSRVFTAAQIPFSIRDSGRSGPGRDLATLDLDAIGVAIPSTGSGKPGELISTLDLFHGARACRAWLSRPL